jgi:chromosome segregation ATPase
MLEHDALAGQIEALRPKVVEMEARVTAARRAVADAEARLNAVRNERATLEQRFRSQVGTRTVAVEEARKGVRAHLCELARRAMEDRNHFGEEYDATREEIGRLTRAHEARLRDVEIYALALESYDHAAFKRGIVVGIFGIIVALLLIIVPVVLKATWPAEPPPLEPPAAH